MTKDYWFISDCHFGHANMLKFTDAAGNPVRPGFADTHHMNEHMIKCWNSVIKPQDHVYFLGDLCFSNQTLHGVMPRLVGHKRLILGNHDNLKMDEYYKYFQKIMSWRNFTEFKHKFIACHFPLHPSSFEGRGVRFNVHGHVHKNSLPDQRYINVSVEVINYTPINVDDLMKLMDNRLLTMDFSKGL